MNLFSKKVMTVTLAAMTTAMLFGFNTSANAEAVLHEMKDKETTVTTEHGSKFAPGEAYVPGGTVLTFEIPEDMNSKLNTKGSALEFKLVEPLLINDVVIIEEGAIATGHVTEQKKSGMFGRAGKLEFSVDSIKARNGVIIPLEYVGRIEAGSDSGAVAVATAVTVVGGAFMKGKNVSIPAGTQLEVQVKEDTDLYVTLDNLEEGMSKEKSKGVAITLK